MEKTESNDALLDSLKKMGVKPGQEYRLVFTKELRIEPVTKTLDINQVLPYPLPETGTCDICQKAFAQHAYTFYFIEPLHIKRVRDFVIALREKLDVTKNMPLKLAVEAPSSVLNPKEIVDRIFELLREVKDINLANHFIRVVSHYTPSESIRYSIEAGRGSLTQKLFQVERHFESLCREWRVELQVHKELSNPTFGFLEGRETETKQTFNELKFAERHESELESHYCDIQSDFHLITARILSYEKLVKKFTELPRFGKIKQALRKRTERPLLPYDLTMGYGYGYPPIRRRRPRI